VNLNRLALFALCFSILGIFGGTVLSRRLRWPYLLPALFFLGLSMGAFVVVWLMVSFYFQFNDDHAIPWFENLGIALGVFAVGSFIACIYFSCAACVVAFCRTFHAKSNQ
jgi:hypothetical protein